MTGWSKIKNLKIRSHFLNNHLDALVLFAIFDASSAIPNSDNTNLINILNERYGYNDFNYIGSGAQDRRIFWLRGNTEISYHSWDCTKVIKMPITQYTVMNYCVSIIYARKKSYPYMDYLEKVGAARLDAILENEKKKQNEDLYKQRKNKTKDF